MCWAETLQWLLHIYLTMRQTLLIALIGKISQRLVGAFLLGE